MSIRTELPAARQTTRSPIMRAITVLVTASLVAISGCASLTPAARAEGLSAFADCDDFLDHVRAEAIESVGPFGWGGQGYPIPELMAGEDGGEAVATSPRAEADPTFSDTNVQEVGVDEPDIVKTNGVHIFTASRGSIRAVLARAGQPKQVGQLKLAQRASEMILHGDRLLVLGDTNAVYRGGIESEMMGQDYPYPTESTTTLIQIDVSDPANMRVVGSAEIPGRYLSARAVDGTVHLVTSRVPQLDFVTPYGEVPRTEGEATDLNQQAVADSQLSDWLPLAAIDGEPGGRVDCANVMHPDEFAGAGLVSVVSFDMSGPITMANSAAVLADGDLVYSSPDNLYVATNQWHPWGFWDRISPSNREKHKTQIHRFSIADETRYVASGSVHGNLLNQFSMSEHDGDLRVASTDFDPRGDGAGDGSQSFVTILRPAGNSLLQVGRVGNLGRGERIYAVRFMGDTGYVVTFRQTDPLYTVDLSRPEQPEVRGELKIKGYSAYLHPIADGRLLGVGQDATAQGRQLGTQVSLFDVSDLSHPDRLDQWSPAGKWSGSEVEYDHHAFMCWAPTGTVVMPLNDHSGMKMLVLDVDDSNVTPRGTIPGPEQGWGPQRSLVIDDSLYAVSDAGVTATDLESLQRTGWVPFDDRAR